jgi:putative transposase
LNTELRICLRLREKRNAQPSAVVFDTQSVKALHGGEDRGFDGYKRVNGRKRFLLVERPKPVRCWCGGKNTLGLLLLVKVVPANTAEMKAAMIGLEKVNEVFDMVELAWADQGFGGEPLRLWMKQELGWNLELTSGISKPGKPDFEVAPRRWVVEWTIAWLCRNRRLLCDFERLVVVSTGWVYAAMTLLMARRLAKTS